MIIELLLMKKHIKKIKIKTHQFLRWTEKYTRTDMVYLAKGGFWSTLSQTISIISVLLISVFFAHFLSKEVYGNYKFIISTISILGALSLSGMGTAVIQAVSRGKDGTLYIAVSTSLKWGVITFISTVIMSTYYYFNKNYTLSIAIIIAGLTTPFISAYGLYGSFLAGRKYFKEGAKYGIITQTINAASILLTTILIPNELALIFVNFTISALVTIIIYIYILKKYKPNNESDNSLIKYGKHISLMNLFGTIASQIDKVLVFHFIGSAGLAIYSFSIAIPEQIRGSYKNLFGITFPKYSSLPEEKLKNSIANKTKKLTLITLVIIIGYILISPLAFKILFPKYLESIFYSQIYMIGLVTIPGISLFGIYFQVKKNTNILYKINLISSITTIILTYFFISNFGIMGVIIENGLSWSLMLLIGWYYFSKN